MFGEINSVLCVVIKFLILFYYRDLVNNDERFCDDFNIEISCC